MKKYSRLAKPSILFALALVFMSACYTPNTQVILPKCLDAPRPRLYISHDWDVPLRKTRVDLEDAGEVTLVSSRPSLTRLGAGALMFGFTGLAGWGYSQDGYIDSEEGVVMAVIALSGTVVALTGWHPANSVVDLSREICANAPPMENEGAYNEGYDEAPTSFMTDDDEVPPSALEPEAAPLQSAPAPDAATTP